MTEQELVHNILRDRLIDNPRKWFYRHMGQRWFLQRRSKLYRLLYNRMNKPLDERLLYCGSGEKYRERLKQQTVYNALHGRLHAKPKNNLDRTSHSIMFPNWVDSLLCYHLYNPMDFHTEIRLYRRAKEVR